MRDPNFIIVGATRCGSTYLMENLIRHPQVFMPVPSGSHSTGDLHFFDISRAEGRENYALGLSWYRSHFQEAKPSQVVGEKTADYFADPEACRLIHEHLGDVRIVVLLREPVQRAYSHFWHERHNLDRFKEFSAFVEHGEDVGDAKVLTSSFYCASLLRYQEAFGSDKVYAIIFEELHADPDSELRKLSRFLGIDENFNFPLKKAHINQGTSSGAVELIRRFATRLKKSAPGAYERLVDSWLGSLARDFLGRKRGTRTHAGTQKKSKPAYRPMEIEDSLRLRELYRKDVEQLGVILGRDLIELWWPKGSQSGKE